ncbi:hypothetical protein EJB05_32950, partial [Eragrostis curvula]
MSQVRFLAQDCNNCLDIYLYRGNPDIHLARGGLRRYLLWVPWFLRKMVAQHRAAVQLRELKERARDVGKRRLRYGVEIPTKAAPPPVAGHTSAVKALSVQVSAGPAAEAGGEEDDEDCVDRLPVTELDGRLDAQDLEDYFNRKLADWMKETMGRSNSEKAAGSTIPSIAVVAPDNMNYVEALAHGALAVAKAIPIPCVLIDIPKVHYCSDPLLPEDILCYLWRELELGHDSQLQSSSPQQQDPSSNQGDVKKQHTHWQSTKKLDIYYEKVNAVRQIMQNIQETMKVGKKIKDIKSDLDKVTTADMLELDLRKTKHDDNLEESTITKQTIAVLLLQLNRSAAAAAAEQYQARKKKTKATSAALCNKLIKGIAKKLKHKMEEEEVGANEVARICLKQHQYKEILREVFLQDQEQETKTASTSALSEDQIKLMICEAKQEILLDLNKMLEDKSGKKPATGKLVCQDQKSLTDTAEAKEMIEKTQVQIPLDDIAEVKQKVDAMQHKIEELMKNKGIMDKIRCYLKDTMIIFHIGRDYILRWEEIRNDLTHLSRVAGAVIVTASSDMQRNQEYCTPPLEPLEYSLAGFYHDIVLKLTRNQKDEEGDSHIESHILRGILDECEPYEFSMKIFAHALYANPKRSGEEMKRLHKTMRQVAPKSFGKLAKKMLKFCYGDLPKEYKNCLMYLAIFPQGYEIRRSTLIGRWVAEGLITTEDWRWHNSVQEAERCFDVLVERCLVNPVDIGATGKVKRCTVGDLIHEFITKIAKKQRIVEARLSHHLARHFSISNDLHLRGSDTIDNFLHNIHESSHLSVLKVLDLEGCQCFKRKQHYLKEICSKILLLKYLSLRSTDVTGLPSEINNLHELEVLDIRDTNLPLSATRHVRLLKLKRLLAGRIDPSPSNTGFGMAANGKEFPISVRIPEKIGKMLDMEVLSNVEGNGQDLKDIGKLWQLRKLGVVIHDCDDQLKNLVQTISDLHECLRSLTITLPITRSKSTPSSQEFPHYVLPPMEHFPQHLESLRIRGTTLIKQILPWLIKEGGQLAKVTLSNTWLEQNDLDALANLTTLQHLKLRREAYSDDVLTFKKEEFKKLKYFLIESSNTNRIIFDGGAAPDLEKIVLQFSGDPKLSGVQNLTKLEELELNNTSSTTTTSSSNNSDSNNPLSILKDAKQIAKVTLRGTLLKVDDLRNLATGSNIRCLILLDNSYVESKLNFKKDEFPKLNLLIVSCSKITNISFESQSAPKINKIIWSYTKVESLYGIEYLKRLRALEFNVDHVPTEVKEDIKKHKNKPYYLHNKPGNQDQATGKKYEEDNNNVARSPLNWIKNKATLPDPISS